MRPSLLVQTVIFHESDRQAAQELAKTLYSRLTRPISDPLGFGAAIPVLSAVDAAAVDLNAADQLVLIIILGQAARAACRQDAARKTDEWARTKTCNLVIVASQSWTRPEFPAGVEFCESTGSEQVTVDRILVVIAKSLGLADAKPVLFISHSGDDPGAQDEAQAILVQARKDRTALRFFSQIVDSIDAESDPSVLEGLNSRALFVAVRTDNYAARVRCADELHRAKVHRIPTLTVEVLKTGEPRSDPYGGNGPSIVAGGDPASIVTRAMIEWVRDRFFQREAARVAAEAGLPEPIIISRPPELFDLAQKDFSGPGTHFVMYPDPELPASESEILLAIRPRVYLTTPLTAYRHFRTGPGGPAAPLDGIQIAISFSSSPDVNGKLGFTEAHIHDAITHMVRTAISAGAVIAYGGDLRLGGYTRLFAQLILAYNRTASVGKERLRNYRPADAPFEDGPVEPYHVAYRNELKERAILPPPPDPNIPSALYLSEMRRLVIQDSHATFILGGKVTPRRSSEKTDDGYHGPFPGIVEEAWRTLEANSPLYLAAGFGGAAGTVAALMRDEETPPELKSTTWSANPFYQDLTQKLSALGWSIPLGLPKSMEELAQKIREKARVVLKNDEASIAWNGLTVEQNRELFRSIDPVRITTLTLKGLLRIREIKGQGKLAVELVHGDLSLAPRASAICVAIYKDAPVAGAGAALDEMLNGAVTRAQASSNEIDVVEIKNSNIDADWLIVSKLGYLQSGQPGQSTDAQIRSAVKHVVERTQRHGFTDLATVTFGGSLVEDPRPACDVMIDEFSKVAGRTRISLFELQEDRFLTLQEHLKARKDVDLTTHRPSLTREPPRRDVPTYLSISWIGDQLSTRLLPPPASGVGLDYRSRLTADEVRELSAGSTPGDRKTPSLEQIESRRQKLAEKLLGEKQEELFKFLADKQVIIRHDLPSAQLPFEMLMAPQKDGPKLTWGISRVLALSGVDPKFLAARPPKTGKINLLLVINPLGDLENARREGAEVFQSLSGNDKINITSLEYLKATKAAVKQALASADIFHYCGHAGFDGPGQSGINLFDGRLTAGDLIDLDSVPRLAFVNGCEAGRVRGGTVAEEAGSQAFAELFLRMGIEAYLGTFWKVGDLGAAKFSNIVYGMLAQGETIGNAVLRGRRELYDIPDRDWVNYVLYGNSDFRISIRSSDSSPA